MPKYCIQLVILFWAALSAQAQLLERRIAPFDHSQAAKFSNANTVGVAILVGVGKYPRYSGLNELHYPDVDVDTVAAALKAQRYLVITLKDSEATKGAVLNAIQQSGEAMAGQDLSIVFFFSGHGFAVNNQNYLATQDANSRDFAASALSLKDVEQEMEKTNATRRIMWIDACRDEPVKGIADARSFANLQASAGTRLLLSTKAGKVSYEDGDLKQGMFSYYLAKGLQGAAAGADNLITFQDLATYVTLQVRARSLELGHVQVPYESGEASGDFLVARLASLAPAESHATTEPHYEPAAPSFNLGGALGEAKVYWEAKHYDLALPLLRKAADSASAEADFYLGDMYENGKGGLPVDLTEAVKWYRRGSDLGDVRAKGSLGAMYLEGWGGLPKNEAMALSLFEEGAAKGELRSMADLGDMYLEGLGGLTKDGSKAVEWYRKAADGGGARGMTFLANMYQSGSGGLQKDNAQAAALYRKAAEAGFTLAMTNLGALLENGEAGVPKEGESSFTWYRKAAEAGDVDGMNNLGRLYATGAGVNADRNEAESWYRKAAGLGSTDAMNNLGILFMDRDDKQAVGWWRKAAEAGDAGGMSNLGTMYDNGRGGLRRDEKLAVAWYRKSAEAGEPTGMYNLAVSYENGHKGLPKDQAQAIAWYKKSAEGGNEPARKALERLGVSKE